MQSIHFPSRNDSFETARRLSVRLLLSTACMAGLAGLVMGAVGCDQVKEKVSESRTNQADRRVAENITKGEKASAVASDKAAKAWMVDVKTTPAPTDTSATKPSENPAITELNDSLRRSLDTISTFANAANEAGASNEARATAKGKLARVEFAMGVRITPEVERKQRQVEVVLSDLLQTGQRIAQSAQTRAGYALHDPNLAGKPSETNTNPISPKATLDARATAITAAFEKAKADADAIREKIDEQKKKIEEMKQDKVKADQKAEGLTIKAADAKGKEGLDLFKQANDAREKGAKLGIEIEAATMALLPYERTLAIAEKQKAAWDNKAGGDAGAMQRLEASSKIQGDTWASRQAEIDKLTASIKDLGKELADHATDVSKTAADAKILRDATASRLTAAIKHFSEAADACKLLSQDLGPKIKDEKFAKIAQLETWKNTLRLYDEAYFRLQQGSVQLAQAELQAQFVRELEGRKRAADNLLLLTKDSGVTPPAEIFPDSASKDLEAARADANSAFTAAEKTLDLATTMAGMAGGDMEATHTAAHLMAIESRVAHAAMAGDGDVVTKLKATLADDKAWADSNKVDLPAGVLGKL